MAALVNSSACGVSGLAKRVFFTVSQSGDPGALIRDPGFRANVVDVADDALSTIKSGDMGISE
jgi:hypothetical protein